MATANQFGTSAAPASLASNPITNGTTAPPTAKASKKTKNGKMDSSETSRLLAAKISQLETDTAQEREQQDEIDREVKKHNRELTANTAKMGDLDKIEHLSKRCSELFASMKRHERESVKNKKRADQLQKEKDSSRTEVSKQTGLKEKLEKLCRELQKDNNKYKNDNRALKDSLAKTQKDSDARFEEVFKTLESYQDEKDNPRKQVMNTKVEDLFRARFKSLIDQYELRELVFHSQMRTKEIEVQWYMSRYEEQKKIAEAEVTKSRQLNGQVLNFHKTETELRTQLSVYVEKFKQVEDTLNNSNDLFLTFRKEMEDMSKKTKRLEKDNGTLERKNKTLSQNIVTVSDERNNLKAELGSYNNKLAKLRSIITQMQQQGRGIPQGMQAAVDSCHFGGDAGEEGELDDGEEESDYEEEEFDDGDEEVSGEYDDDTEEEVHEPVLGVPVAQRSTPYAHVPVPTPPTSQNSAAQAAIVSTNTNGHS